MNSSDYPFLQKADSKQVEFERSSPLVLDKRSRVLVIAGPTAVGKSALAMDLARRLSGEIVSCDSMQVYRGMDIGTAKPTREELEEIAHHMIDIRDIKDPINVAQFTKEALEALRSITARSKTAIVVGGSGFYVDCLLRGAPSGPSADPFIRAHLESEMEKVGPEPLYDRLCKLDPLYAKTITFADRHKILRALEIMMITGKEVSQISRASASKEFHFLCYFLDKPRDRLYKDINFRCQEMLDLGLIAEVQQLIHEGLLENSSAASAIGYRQTLEFLGSDRTCDDYDHFVQRFMQASRHYAKRQFTWFRRDKAFNWLDISCKPKEMVLQEIIEEYYSHF